MAVPALFLRHGCKCACLNVWDNASRTADATGPARYE